MLDFNKMQPWLAEMHIVLDLTSKKNHHFEAWDSRLLAGVSLQDHIFGATSFNKKLYFNMISRNAALCCKNGNQTFLRRPGSVAQMIPGITLRTKCILKTQFFKNAVFGETTALAVWNAAPDSVFLGLQVEWWLRKWYQGYDFVKTTCFKYTTVVTLASKFSTVWAFSRPDFSC